MAASRYFLTRRKARLTIAAASTLIEIIANAADLDASRSTELTSLAFETKCNFLMSQRARGTARERLNDAYTTLHPSITSDCCTHATDRSASSL
jgi:hypothetical protein